MSSKGHRKFRKHDGYFKPIPKPGQNPNLETKLIRCPACKQLFVASIPAYGKVRCPHCRARLVLDNPKWYMEIEGMTQEEANKLNSNKTLMVQLVNKITK